LSCEGFSWNSFDSFPRYASLCSASGIVKFMRWIPFHGGEGAQIDIEKKKKKEEEKKEKKKVF